MWHAVTQITLVTQPVLLSLQASHIQMELCKHWYQQSKGQRGSKGDHHCWRCGWHRTGVLIPRILPREKKHLGIRQGLQGYFGERPKDQKNKNQGGLCRKKHGKIEGLRGRRDQSCVNRLLVSALIWPCPVTDGHRLSCPLTEIHFYHFQGERTALCASTAKLEY